MELPSSDDLYWGALRFLVAVEEDEKAAADVLASCSLAYDEIVEDSYEGHVPLRVALTCGTRKTYEVLNDESSGVSRAIKKSLNVHLPLGIVVKYLVATIQPIHIDQEQQAQLLGQITEKGVRNQALGAEHPREWNRLYFRSETEIRIARTLEEKKALFFPNCVARTSTPSGRTNLEPDFLVYYDGKWGILEVDGPHHTGKAATDHDRDRVFRSQGIKVERYDAKRCYSRPDEVVEDFMKILKAN